MNASFQLAQDIDVLFLRASSFPDGVLAAHQQLHKALEGKGNRSFYGISWMGNGSIIYLAAAEMLDAQEPELYGFETFVIEKGEYDSISIVNFRDNIPAIGKAFETLLQNPRLDPNGVCVEMYLGNEDAMRCMVRLLPDAAL